MSYGIAQHSAEISIQAVLRLESNAASVPWGQWYSAAWW
jgi:hypothetical protein